MRENFKNLMLFFAVFSSSLLVSKHEEMSFLSYMRKTKQFFVGEEYSFRLGIYLTRMRYIQEFNQGSHSFLVGENRLMHLTTAEYRSILGAKRGFEAKNAEIVKAPENGPKEIDWRTKGIVNPVKDQGSCGSCWAFSAITAQESQWAKVHNELFSLSESNLVDCVTAAAGCGGGWPYDAYDYVRSDQDGMFMKDSDYPYQPVTGMCKFDKTKGVTKIQSYTISKLGDDVELANRVASHGVASVCIDASLQSFHMYSSGIYDDMGCSAWDLDHAVGLVGYGTEGSKDFWIIRNSWGSDWGESGYIRILRGDDLCGVSSMAVLPSVGK